MPAARKQKGRHRQRGSLRAIEGSRRGRCRRPPGSLRGAAGSRQESPGSRSGAGSRSVAGPIRVPSAAGRGDLHLAVAFWTRLQGGQAIGVYAKETPPRAGLNKGLAAPASPRVSACLRVLGAMERSPWSARRGAVERVGAGRLQGVSKADLMGAGRLQGVTIANAAMHGGGSWRRDLAEGSSVQSFSRWRDAPGRRQGRSGAALPSAAAPPSRVAGPPEWRSAAVRVDACPRSCQRHPPSPHL